MNKVSFKATITAAGNRAISSSGKSARFFLTGMRSGGEFFTVKALFIGAALEYLLKHHEIAVNGKFEQPLAFEGTGVMKSNSWQVDGKTMRDTFVLVSDAPTPVESFETEDNPGNGRPSLVDATLDAEFTARVFGDVEAGKKGTLQLLVQEASSAHGYRTYVRYPAATKIGAVEGDTVEILGRLAWIKGKSWVKPVIGVEAESITVQAGAESAGGDSDAAASPSGEFVEEEVELPF